MKAVVLALLLLLVLACPARSAQCVNSDEDRERIRAIALEAFDHALQLHVEHLFGIWVRDESLEPKRAITGFNIGLSAYTRARASAQQWNPPICPQ